ncbi:MAG: serine/threonine protein kinase, partial [Nannocystaceae bacterium]|nr:serine/threonine protein kinase [Nannocystaceae bacterium]
MGCIDEATALAFARGELGSDAVAALTEHIDVCDECRALVALAASGHGGTATGEAGAAGDSTAPVMSSPATVPHSAGAVRLTRGTAVDRFTIITSIGRGAMGEVYAAYDPGLNRKVALKFLNADVGSLDDPRARLLREARAMATVSHPNVVAVHDIGVHDGHPYIAMAFIEGTTLRGWCDSATRSVAEILTVYRRAAAGLAAAHAQGMVHRDFKPENVLVGVDNRVYVTDFGLVSGVADPQPSHSQSVESQEAELGQTRTGALIGTPAYMAPEQLRGERADARSDQFSFCVSLWEALSGHRPYGGGTLAALLAAIERGGFSPQGIPRWLVPTLVAGLSADASGRHASMDVLIARLQRRRKTVGWQLVAGFVATGLAWSGLNGGQPSDPCSDSRRFLDDIWDEGRRSSLEEVFASSDVPFVVQGQSQAFAALDDYASRWAVAHRGACRAAHRADTSRGLGALACLDRRLLDINALVDVLHRGDSVAMEHAVGAVERLDNVESCLEAVPLALALPEGTTAEQVARVRRGLADVHAHVRTRLLEQAVPVAQTALDDATELGYAPLTAEASRALGQVQQGLGRLNVAEPLLEEAVWLAQAADHQAEQFAASLLLVSLIGEAHRPKDAMRWARNAQAQLDRHGGTATQRSNLANARGWVLQDA